MKFNRAQVDSLLLQLRDASDEMRRRLSARQPCRAEELFQLYPRLHDEPELAVRLVHAEWAARVELGERPAVSQWLERFPQWRPQLERRFREDSFLDAEMLENTPTIFLGHEGEDALGATRPAAHPGGHFPPGEAPLPPLEVHEEIGRGAMGVVYRARDKVLERPVALKKIRAGRLDNAEAVRRFYHEARAAARLNHPNIIAVHGLGQVEGQHAFTMPLAKANLDEHRDRFTQPRVAAALLAKVARAVHHAHRHGLVHRDLKPANILLDARDEPLVADFGVAVLLDEVKEPGEGRAEVAGTPPYMAPEQFGAFGARVSEATDVWALGVILYELLAGVRPFTAKTLSQLQAAVREAEPPPLVSKSRGVDRGLEAIVRRCLAKDPHDRYATAEELAQDLDDWRDGKPIRAKPDNWPRRTWRAVWRHPALATAVALLMLFGLVGGLLYAFAPAPVRPPSPPEDPDVVALRSIYARLKKGETVEFVTPGGKLLRGRWVHDSGGDEPNDDKQGVDVHTQRQAALFELLPEVPLEKYDLSVEVRQWHEMIGPPGIYALHHADQIPDPADPERELLAHSFLSLSFGEVKPWKDILFASLEYQGRTSANSGLTTKPLPENSGPWHTFSMQVTPEQVRLLHNGTELVTVTPADVADRTQRMRRGQAVGGGPAITPAFDFKGGVGLYLIRAQATYRSITLKPLP
jgi:serine/threonine-protein kinase